MKQLATRRLWLLGPTRIDLIQPTRGEAREVAEWIVPRFRSRRTVGLLGYLVTEQRAIARDFLAGFFWPDESEAKGRANLSRELHNLAQILPACFQTDRKSVSFIPSDSTKVDLYDILQLEAQERWGEAEGLLGGEFLEGLVLPNNSEYELWLLGERERWRTRSIEILKRIIDGHTIRGRYDDALHNAQRLLQLAPWDEEIHRQIMRFLAWTGQRGTALRQFETCKQVLKEELDVEVADTTIVLYQQIQAGRLDLPPQLPVFLSEEEPRRKYERPLFVGREAELAQLDEFLNAALVGRGRVIFVTGDPGQGKTALMEDFAQRAMETHPGLLVAGGKCNAFSGLGDPFLPFRDVMAMLTGDVEGRWDVGAISLNHARRLWDAFSLVVQIVLDHGLELLDFLIPGDVLLSRSTAAGQEYVPSLPRLREQVGRRATSVEPVEQSQLFQQVTNVLRILAQAQPLLLILDDFQWADTASISLLFHLGRHFANAEIRILITCAYRPEEVAMSREGKRHPLAKVISEFKRTFGDGWLNLGQTKESTKREFVNALIDTESNRLGPAFRAVLYDRTGGHPLFTVELLRALQGRGELIKDEKGQWIEGSILNWELLPERAEAIIEERIHRLSPDLQEILTIASVEGELFTAQVLAEVSQVPERSILHRLSQELERRHRLVIEQEEVYTGQRRLSRYRFGHILYQNYLYRKLGKGEQRLLHEDVAIALEKLYDGQLDEIAVQLAHHFQQADDHGNACSYFARAGERASRLYESTEAVTNYTRAIEMAEKVFTEATTLAKLHYGRGLAFERLGEFGQAQTDLSTTLQIAREACEYQIEADAQLELGRLWASRDQYQARDYFEAALELARRIGGPFFLAKCLNWMGNWHMNSDNFKKALAFHSEALIIFEDLRERREVANTLDLLGIANLMGGDLNSCISYYGQAVLLCRELDNPLRLASSLLGRATACSMLLIPGMVAPHPSPDPIADIREARQIAEKVGSASNRIWVDWSLGLFHTMHGQFGCALTVLQRGLQVASDIGHREWIVGNRFALGLLYTELYALDQAQWQLERGLALAEKLRSPMWIHFMSGALANVYLMLDDRSSARNCLEKSILADTPMETLGKRYCWMRRAELALADGNQALALTITNQLIATALDMELDSVITYLWMLKAEALVANEHASDASMKEAHTLLHAAIKNAEANGERFLLWRLHACLGRLCRAMGHQEAVVLEASKVGVLIEEFAKDVTDKTLRDTFLQGAYSYLKTRLLP